MEIKHNVILTESPAISLGKGHAVSVPWFAIQEDKLYFAECRDLTRLSSYTSMLHLWAKHRQLQELCFPCWSIAELQSFSELQKWPALFKKPTTKPFKTWTVYSHHEWGKKWKSFVGKLVKKQHLEPFCNREHKGWICTAILGSPSVLWEVPSQGKERRKGKRESGASAAGQPQQVLWEQLKPHVSSFWVHTQAWCGLLLTESRALQQAEQKWGHHTNLTERLSESPSGASLSTSVSWRAGQVGSHYFCTIVQWYG